MHDPFPLAPPSFLTQATQPFAKYLSLPTLPLHIHELLFAALTYHLTCSRLSPYLSTRLFPTIYPSLSPRTRLNWDVHVVSLVQSVFINAAALWVMWRDEERRGMSWEERVWGYTGADGMIQGFAAGYFLWDLVVCAGNVGIFGWGLLAHAVAALMVFSLGFVSIPKSWVECGRMGRGERRKWEMWADDICGDSDLSSTFMGRRSYSTSSPRPF